MPVIYREQKGSPLTSMEMDGNFKELEKKILALESHLDHLTGGIFVRMEGDELIFENRSGHEIGRGRVPFPFLQGVGLWKKDQDYLPFQVVTHKTKAYLCRKAHQSTSFKDDKECWQVLLDLSAPLDQQQNNPSKIDSVPIYEKGNLPKPELGKIVMVADQTGSQLAYGDGENWRVIASKKAS